MRSRSRAIHSFAVRAPLRPLAALLGLTLLLSACGPCDVSGQRPLTFTQGRTSADGSFYETTHPGEDMLHFPPGRVYHLHHGLRNLPTNVRTYVSFTKRLSEDGNTTDPLQPNHIAESAGNVVVIEAWNDEYIQVRNDTCADFYLRLEADARPDELK